MGEFVKREGTGSSSMLIGIESDLLGLSFSLLGVENTPICGWNSVGL